MSSQMKVKPLLEDFDFSILDDPHFKEDSVREDILMPILTYLGFRGDKNPRIVRSKTLLHPYVMFGTQKRKINIIPDYIIYDEDQVRLVIDAKAPNENIETGDNVCQAYSYAIHPEIRSRYFALCNGRLLTIFSIFKTTPQKVFTIPNMSENDRLELFQKLRMIKTDIESAMNFDLDFGLFVRLNGCSENMRFIFMDTPMSTIGKMSDDSYTFGFASEDFTDRKLLVTIDFINEHYQKLLKILPASIAEEVRSSLSKQPYSIHFKENPPRVMATTEGFEPIATGRTGEEFIPLKLVEFKKINKI